MLTQSRKSTQNSSPFSPKKDCKELYKYIANFDKDFIQRNNLGDIFVRNLEQTQFCDQILNLEEERSSVLKQINHDDKDRYSRLLIKDTELSLKDSTIATEAFVQHFGKIRTMVIQTLPFYDRFSFAFKDWVDFNFR